MGNLLEQTLINKLNDELNCAITSVGGNTNYVDDIFDYAKVIRKQLTAAFDVQAGPGIDVKVIKPNSGCDCGHDSCGCGDSHCDCCHDSCGCCDCDCHCKRPILYIGANSDALISRDITLPDGSIIKADEKTTVQDVFAKLFDEVIPGLNIFESGSVIKTTKEGIDISVPEKPVANLKGETSYIRLNFAKKNQPIYIEVQSLIDESKSYTDEQIAKLRKEVTKEVMHYRGRSATDPFGPEGAIAIDPEGNPFKDFKPGDVISYLANEYIRIINKEGNEVWTLFGDEGKVSKADLEREAKFRKDNDEAIIKLIGEKTEVFTKKIEDEKKAREDADEFTKKLLDAAVLKAENDLKKEAKFREDNDNATNKLIDTVKDQLSSKIDAEKKAREDADEFTKKLLDASIQPLNEKTAKLEEDLKKERETSLHFVGVSSTDPTSKEGPHIEGITEYQLGDVVLYSKVEYMYVKEGTLIHWIKLGNDVNPDDFLLSDNINPIDVKDINNIDYDSPIQHVANTKIKTMNTLKLNKQNNNILWQKKLLNI